MRTTPARPPPTAGAMACTYPPGGIGLYTSLRVWYGAAYDFSLLPLEARLRRCYSALVNGLQRGGRSATAAASSAQKSCRFTRRQRTGEALLRKLWVATGACVSGWRLESRSDASAEWLRGISMRLSGRQVKRSKPVATAGLWVWRVGPPGGRRPRAGHHRLADRRPPAPVRRPAESQKRCVETNADRGRGVRAEPPLARPVHL